MKRSDWKRYLKMTVLSAVVYWLLDLPVQATGFLTFGSYIGIKNFLPTTLGLQFGPWGVLGAWIGCMVTALSLGTPAAQVLLECLCILIMGIGAWILWHIGSGTHRIHFKRGIHYLKYLGLLVGLSAICGALSFLFLDGGAFVSVLAAYTALGLLVGIPVNIMANGLFCLEPVLPPPFQTEYAVTGCINSDPDSISALNEALEDFAFSRRLNQRRIFEIQNCLEELSIRILTNSADAQIQVRIHYDDTISARLSYSGGKCNPLHVGKNEDELDLISLKLIRHRALRASYRYQDRTNYIHVVV